MVKVYMEDGRGVCSEHVATFASEAMYMVCLPALEAYAVSANMIVTESIDDED